MTLSQLAPRQGPASTLRIGERFSAAAILVWVALNFGWTLLFQFTNDDYEWLEHADLRHAASIRDALLSPIWSRSFLRPLVQLSFVLNRVFGVDALPYHLVNVVLHGLNALLVWQLARRVIGRPLEALLAALLFAAHPTMTEAVAWVSGRTELICAAFYLAALLAHHAERPRRALTLAALALLSKESAVSLPCAIAVLDGLNGRSGPQRLRRVAPYFLLIAIYFCLRALLVDEYAHGLIGLSPYHPLSQANVILLLRSKITMLGQYFFEPLTVQGFWRSLLCFAAAALLTVALARHADALRRRALAFAALWIVVTLIPYLGTRAIPTWYVYVPLVGAALLQATMFGVLWRLLPRQLRAVAGVVAAIWLAAAAYKLQVNNRMEYRAGLATTYVLDRLVASLASTPHPSLLVVDGLGPLRLGMRPWTAKPILIGGLASAVRIRLNDRTVDVAFAGDESAAPASAQVATRRRWNEATQAFEEVVETPP
ncbi:MAG: glycosyltransferase family 39 protein [Deltaproteobacteria bacterium]|nr:glycosyltransferase family 39 protein [Deltaproteobacteria bacterium]